MGSTTIEERRSPHDSVADMNILSVEVSSLFNKAMDHLDAIEKAMLEHVLVRNAVSLEEFAERSALSQEDAHTRFTVLLSKLKHPFFGYGPALDSAKLAWQAEAQCVRDDLSRIVQTTEVDRRIKSTCLNCPVIQECDDYASSKKNKIITGVWGGKLRTIR